MHPPTSVPDESRARRLIAVEEHFGTESYYEPLESWDVPPAEESEHRFMLHFPRNPEMLEKFTDPQKMIDSIDVAGIDISFIHCGRALKRSSLWDPATQANRTETPPIGVWLRDQTRPDAAEEELIRKDDAADLY